jgi:DNA adenine methylase
MKPIFKYSGGKSKEIKIIEKYLPQAINRVIEPFSGSAALSFHLEKESIISDVRENNIITFEKVRDNFDEIHSKLDEIKKIKDIKELERIYYFYRDEKFQTKNQVEQAIRWIVLRQLCFSGMDRINKSNGKFSVPFGWYKKFNCNLDTRHKDFLQKSEIILGDWKVSFDMGEKDDFIFLDPPYFNRNSEYGGDYVDGEDLHIQISERFKNSKSNCFLIHVDCELYRNLYEGYNIIEKPFTYSQNFKGRNNSNQKVNHLYIYNYEISGKTTSPLF